MYADNELLFPAHVISSLRHARGEEWGALSEHITTLPEDSIDSLAFSLMMVRLNGCLSCETDSYRAMRGCKACAIQSLRRFKGPDLELLNIYQDAREDVQKYLEVHLPKVVEKHLTARAA